VCASYEFAVDWSLEIGLENPNQSEFSPDFLHDSKYEDKIMKIRTTKVVFLGIQKDFRVAHYFKEKKTS